jgi:hypothetical protein
MHPNVKRGNLIHAQHFHAIWNNGSLAPGIKVHLVNQSISDTCRLRPDWVLIDERRKRGYILDVTTKYRHSHFAKGLLYKAELNEVFNPNKDPGWEFIYIEDYWLDAVYH